MPRSSPHGWFTQGTRSDSAISTWVSHPSSSGSQGEWVQLAAMEVHECLTARRGQPASRERPVTVRRCKRGRISGLAARDRPKVASWMERMSNHPKIPIAVAAAALCTLMGPVVGLGPSEVASSQKASSPRDNEELRRLHDEDQADRSPGGDKPIDWTVVGPRDQARLNRVKSLFAEDRLKTANDYFHAAVILQHGDVPEDFLLAHEFCVVAITKGKNDKDTRWLAASGEDRFLMNIGRPQRFATQFRSEGD